jgi:hypothetical protein
MGEELVFFLNKFLNLLPTILPMLIGLIGALTGVISLYISFKKQSELYREQLYNKQIEGYMEMIKDVSDLFLLHKSIILSKATSELNYDLYSLFKETGEFDENEEDPMGKELSILEKNITKEKNRIKTQKPILKERYDILINKYYIWSVVLSKEFNEKFLKFNSEFMNVVEYTKKNSYEENNNFFDKEIYSNYYNSYIELLRSARKSLGTEPLNEESYKIINNMFLKKISTN